MTWFTKSLTGTVLLSVLCTPAAMADGHYGGAAECEAYARNEARRAGRIVGGAARGAARGAILGGIVGDNSRAARRGARLGAIAGGARRARERDRAYQRAYDTCMADMRRRAAEEPTREETNDDN